MIPIYWLIPAILAGMAAGIIIGWRPRRRAPIETRVWIQIDAGRLSGEELAARLRTNFHEAQELRVRK